MRGGAACLAAVVAVFAAPAAALEAPTGWNGTNPFRCELQDAGFGTELPDPGADPYCVEFDKRRQNVTELGIVDFLSKEPARVSAAAGKCFYFQSDHWRASVVQDDGSTKLYEWDGHYFFDKARGDGGAWVTNFNVNGRTGDPSSIPGIPPEWAQYLGPGTGGVITHDDIPADPRCVETAAAGGVYADTGPAPGEPAAERPCPSVGARFGPLALGQSEGDARAALGAPREVRRGFLRWCADGGGELLAGVPGDRSGNLGSDPGARIVMLVRLRPGKHRAVAYDHDRIRGRRALRRWLRRAGR